MSDVKRRLAKSEGASSDGTVQRCLIRVNVSERDATFRPNLQNRLACIDAAAIAFVELTAETEMLESDERTGGAAWPLLRLEGCWEPWDRGVRAPDVIKRRLRVLLKAAVANVGRWTEAVALLAAADQRHGHLRGSVIVLAEEEAGHWERMEDKEKDDSVEHEALKGSASEWRSALRHALAATPDEYRSRHKALAAASVTFRLELARALEPALNAAAAAMPQESYEDKKALARWLNAELRTLGLALRDEVTGRPCLLVGDPGNRPGLGRFVLDYLDDGRRVHAWTSVTLPPLRIMPDDLSRAPYGSRSPRSR